jgi:hypothetical protein
LSVVLGILLAIRFNDDARWQSKIFHHEQLNEFLPARDQESSASAHSFAIGRTGIEGRHNLKRRVRIPMGKLGDI